MTRREEEVREFYNRWSPSVFTLCRLLLGNGVEAERITAEVFLTHIREGQPLQQKYVLPVLLGTALSLVRTRISETSGPPQSNAGLDEAIRGLPSPVREIFILRHVLQLNDKAIYVATGLPKDAIQKLSFQALLKVREQLMRDFFKE